MKTTSMIYLMKYRERKWKYGSVGEDLPRKCETLHLMPRVTKLFQERYKLQK